MSQEPRGVRRVLRPRAAAALALALVLGGCGGGSITAAESADLKDLDYAEIEGSVTDNRTRSTVTLHAVIPNFPLPEGYEAPDGARALVLVDVTVDNGNEVESTLRPSDFQLHSSEGDPLVVETGLDVTLTGASFWPLEELGTGRSQRGWLVFPLTWETLDGAELVMTRPSNARLPNGAALEAAEFRVTLGLG